MTQVRVYKSRIRADLYLYVDAEEDLERVPEALLERFGLPVEALCFELTPDRSLARASAGVVLTQIDEAGFYLQLPPDPNAWNAR